MTSSGPTWSKLPSVTMLLAVMVAVALRMCVSLHGYSGQGKPPMFGDYEAQRHWMEVTLNLPLKDWYFNTTDNDLLYWGLDYPPLTAYHSLLCGYFAKHVNPNFTALITSRGIESPEHKFFMRATVLIADLLVFIPAIWWFVSNKTSMQENNQRNEDLNQTARKTTLGNALMFLFLIYPGIILIDHGHFQYNNVSLGLFIAAVAAINRSRLLVGSFLFCLAVNYKQMELYHALPFFCFLLGSCCPHNNQTFKQGFVKLVKIGAVVATTFLIIWLPFVWNFNLVMQVLHRLFPLARGVFEDKVANVWCSINIIYKLRNSFSNAAMAKLCLTTTLLALLPNCADLLLRPDIKRFRLALINSSLAFFLFSFQVHEKSILLVAIPVALHFLEDPLPCFWFLLISIFSMMPLLIKDGLLISSFALTIFYVVTVTLIINFDDEDQPDPKPLSRLSIHEKLKSPLLYLKTHSNALSTNRKILWTVFYISMVGCVILVMCSSFLNPPVKYPDIYQLLIAVYSCIHFLIFFVYFNYRQILYSVAQIKNKSS